MASVFPPEEPGRLAGGKLLRRVLETRAFAIGDYAAGGTNGKPTITFGCPVFDGSDQVQGVVFAAVELDWLASAGSEVAAHVPAGANWTELDRNGTVLACYPAAKTSYGLPFPDHALVNTIFSQPDGLVAVPGSSGLPGFSAFAQRDSQLVAGKVAVLLHIPRQLLFAEGNRALIRNLLWLGAAAGLALALGWVGSSVLVIRPVKALVGASARLATGELSTRTGLRHGKDELGQLTRTFDQMAQALEQRELDRQLAEETLQTRDTMIRELPLLPAAVCVCDQFGAVELYNRSAVELWGWEPPDHPPHRRFCGSFLLYHADGTPMPHSESPAAEGAAHRDAAAKPGARGWPTRWQPRAGRWQTLCGCETRKVP